MVLFSWYINPTSLRFFLLDVTFCTTFRFLPHQPNLWPTLHSGRVFCCEPTTRISPSTSSDDMLTKFCTDVQQQKHLLDSTLDADHEQKTHMSTHQKHAPDQKDPQWRRKDIWPSSPAFKKSNWFAMGFPRKKMHVKGAILQFWSNHFIFPSKKK